MPVAATDRCGRVDFGCSWAMVEALAPRGAIVQPGTWAHAIHVRVRGVPSSVPSQPIAAERDCEDRALTGLALGLGAPSGAERLACAHLTRRVSGSDDRPRSCKFVPISPRSSS